MVWIIMTMCNVAWHVRWGKRSEWIGVEYCSEFVLNFRERENRNSWRLLLNTCRHEEKEILTLHVNRFRIVCVLKERKSVVSVFAWYLCTLVCDTPSLCCVCQITWLTEHERYSSKPRKTSLNTLVWTMFLSSLVVSDETGKTIIFRKG